MSVLRCSAFIATSLDGFIARRDGTLDWLELVSAPGEDYGYRAFLDGVDTLLVGRGTYDAVLAFPDWPYAGKRVAVLTHRPPPARHGEVFVAGEPAGVLARLERDGTRHVYVDGGAVVSAFLRAGLLDDLTISVIPVLLGDGLRLFQGPLPERTLALESARSYPSGLVQLRYRAA